MSDFLYRQHAGLIAAADRLDHSARVSGWYKGRNSWRDLDPISRDEFLGIVYGIVSDYETAFQQAKPENSDPFVNEIVTRFVEEVTWAPDGVFPEEIVAEVNTTTQKKILDRGAVFLGKPIRETRSLIAAAFPEFAIEVHRMGEAVSHEFRPDRIQVWHETQGDTIVSVCNR